MNTLTQYARAKLALASAVVLSAMTSPVFAQSAPTTPVELLNAHSTTFVADTKSVLFAGAGLIIGALLIKALVNLVISFFRRG